MTTTATPAPVILWFRRDLRLHDNPALERAAATGRPLLCVYVMDEMQDGRTPGGASRWWLDKSLRALAAALADRGGDLVLRRGDSETELRRLIEETGADALYLNRLFEPDGFARDADTAHAMKADGVECHGYNGALLTRPGSVLNGSGKPYKVFTPFKNALLAQTEPPHHTLGPRDMSGAPRVASDDINDWNLHPARPDWSAGFDWTPGEAGATEALSVFVRNGLNAYAATRDMPASAGCSRLSPHLHWGEISPWRVVDVVRKAATDGHAPAQDVEKFIAEIAWREFSAHLLHHFPHLVDRPFRPEFDAFAWRQDTRGLDAWKRGMTGYPLIDAGMRQLWTTGWMHNRVRMVAASFLVKHLMVDWREGEAWFWDTLVDADRASNAQNWQWVAGSGADAAPYFRIFNPVTQGEKFDAQGAYVRLWVPELGDLGDKWIHSPWGAPKEVLAATGVVLGRDYPRPIVDHSEARNRALAAFKGMGEQDGADPED